MFNRRSSINLVICYSLCTAAALSQSLIKGSVRDITSHEALPFVRIVVDCAFTIYTNNRGAYSVSIPTGNHAIEYHVFGYRLSRDSISTHHNDTVVFNVLLTPVSFTQQAVTVTGERPPMSTISGLPGLSLEPKELQKIDGPFNDVFRSIQTVAGVVSNNEMSSRLQIRGGLADENLLLLNGGQIFEPFHLKEFPGASLTTMNGELLKRITFLPGGFPARYGDRLSAVLDLEYREGDPDRLKGSVSASLSDGSVAIEGPLAKTVTGLLNVRTTYSDYITKYLVEGDRRSPQFYDIQGIIGWDMAANRHLAVHFLHTHDQTSGFSDGEYGSTAVGGTYTAAVSDHSTITGTVSLYRQNDDLRRTVVIYRDTTDTDIILREGKASLHHWISDQYDILIGAEAVLYEYVGMKTIRLAGATGDSLVSSSINTRSSKFSGYMENRISISRRLLLNLGLRLDHSSLTSETVLAPRAIVTVRLDSVTTLKASGGLYYQSATYDQLLAAARHQYAPPSMQKAYHAVLGIERPLRADLSFRMDLFHKRLFNIMAAKQHESGELELSGRNDSEAKMSGADIEMSFSDTRAMGWINFSILYADERNSLLGGNWHPRVTDQRRTLSTVFEYKVTSNFAFSVRVFYGEGFPLLSDTTKPFKYPFEHQPEYKRVDCGARYTLLLDNYRLTFMLDIQNLLDYRNVAMSFGRPPEETGYNWYLLLPRVVNLIMKFEF